jgi:hypothetical protein
MQREEFAIVAPAAKVMLVAMLVALARSESTEKLAADPDGPAGEPLLRQLGSLTLAELERLAERSALRLLVSCGREELAWSLQASARKRAEQTLLEYFVRHGAPRTLLRALFSASRRRIETVRERLRIPSSPGRPKLPLSREREAIVTAWVKLEGSADRRAGYYALHRMFPRYSIATLDQVLREVSPERALARPRPENRPSAEPVSGRGTERAEAPGRSRATVVHRRVPK